MSILRGRKLQDQVDFDEESEVIPNDLMEDVENGAHDGQEYEGYMGNVSAFEFRLTMCYQSMGCKVQVRCRDVSQYLVEYLRII